MTGWQGAVLYTGQMAYLGFKALQAKAGGGAKGAAIAAAVGRKKYGKQRFQQMAAEGKRRASGKRSY